MSVDKQNSKTSSIEILVQKNADECSNDCGFKLHGGKIKLIEPIALFALLKQLRRVSKVVGS